MKLTANWLIQSQSTSRAIRRVLSERVAFGILPAALFELLPSWPLFQARSLWAPTHLPNNGAQTPRKTGVGASGNGV
jgi:hypothetical protein